MELGDEMGDGQMDACNGELWRHGHGNPTMRSSATGGARTWVRVWRVPGEVAELNAQLGGPGEASSAGAACALRASTGACTTSLAWPGRVFSGECRRPPRQATVLGGVE
jgi:hypothetical protein